MRSRSKRQSMIALAGLMPAMLLALSAVPARAQAAAATNPSRGPIPIYDTAHEITVNGTVQEVVTKRTIGSPAGMHLMISGAQGLVDAHVGPFLTKNMQQAMHTGLPLKVVGVMITARDRQILLVRELSYGGQTVLVRNKNGIPFRPALPSNSPALRKNPWLAMNGGAR
jgi:hypothetical protein